eukprot:3928131-Amphidinium_carterae.2
MSIWNGPVLDPKFDYDCLVPEPCLAEFAHHKSAGLSKLLAHLHSDFQPGNEQHKLRFRSSGHTQQLFSHTTKTYTYRCCQVPKEEDTWPSGLDAGSKLLWISPAFSSARKWRNPRAAWGVHTIA